MIWRGRRTGRAAVTAIGCLSVLAVVKNDGYGETLPSPWTARDIGSATPAGSATYKRGTFTLSAAGGTWTTSDELFFMYLRVSGDVDVIARVDSIRGPDVWSDVGVMIRASLAPDAPHGLTMVSVGKGLAFQRRTAAGRTVTLTRGPLASAPSWVRIIRLGATVHSYWSADGVAWREFASDTIALGA